MNNLGAVESEDGNYTVALEDYNFALDYYKWSQNKAAGAGYKKLLFSILHSIVNCSFENGNAE